MGKASRYIVFTLVWLLAVMTSPYAAEYYVSSTNFQTSFQAALTAAAQSSGDDTIHLPAGAYNLTAMLYYPVENGGAPGSLTIEGPSADNRTSLYGNENFPLLSIDYWYGYCQGDSCSRPSDENTSLTIKNITFSNGRRSGSESGDIYAGGLHITVNYATVLIKDCTFSANSVYNEGAGGLYVETYHDQSVTIQGCSFVDNNVEQNSSGRAAAGAYIYGGDFSGQLSVLDNTFERNISYYGEDTNAGGLVIEWWGNAQISRNRFVGNEAVNNPSSYISGGAYADVYGWIVFEENALIGNIAPWAGGAYLQSDDNITIARNTFSQNSAANYEGGALIIEGDSINIKDNRFLENSAVNGGGAVDLWGHAAIVNNLFYKNFAVDSSPPTENRNGNGGAIFLSLSYPVNITNNTFVGNRASHKPPPLVVACDYPGTYQRSDEIDAWA